MAILLSVSLLAYGQSTRVRGKVIDGETGEPLPFVGVYFDGTTVGISTDLDGRYSLETNNPDALVLTAQLIGYETLSIPVSKSAFTEVNFRLNPDPKQLNAAHVKPDDRYIKSILRKLDRSREKNDPDNAPDWKSRLYSKMEIDVTSFEDLFRLGVIKRGIGFVEKYRDTSAITGKAYIPALISENVSDLYHSQNPNFLREVTQSSRVSGFEQDNFFRQFTGSYLLKTNFYKDNIGVFNLVIPNPAASANHFFYNYFLVDSLNVDSRKTYVLRFHPKKLVTSPTIDGEMQIDAEDFGIRSVHARLSNSSNVNWIRHINMDIENKRLENGQWFYDNERMFLDFSISVSDSSRILSFLGHRQIKYGPPVFEPLDNTRELQTKDAVIMSASVPQSEEWWDQQRPMPLTEREKGVYQMVDEVKDRALYKWSYGIIRTLAAGYYEVPPWKVEFGRCARSFVYNDVEGFRMMVGARTLKDFSKFVRLGSYVAYGFKDRKPKWEGTVELMFRRDRTRKLTLSARHDFVQLGAGTGVFTAQNMFSSLVARSHANRQSLVRNFDVLYEHEFIPQLNAQVQWTTSRIWSNPIVPFIRRSNGEEMESFSVNTLHAGLRFSWDERVNRNYFKKTYLFTKYPVLTMDFYGGIPGITKDDVKYFRTDATVTWRVPSTAIGFGRLFLEGGIINGSIPYPLLKLHEGNQTLFMDRTAFSCMDYYEFISDRWLSGYYEHNFNGFFFGKIPYLKELDLREVAIVRFAWGTISKNNRENAPVFLPVGSGSLELPYVEAGFGISNILRVLRIDFMWRVTHLRPEKGKNFTVNVGIDVDF